MKLNRTQIIGIFFMAVAIFFACFTPQIVVRKGLYEPGARLFPYFAEAIVFICSLIMTITSRNKTENKEKPFLDSAGWKRLCISVVLMAAYAAGLSFLGFLIATPIFSMIFIYVLKGDKRVNPFVAIALSLILTFGINALFVDAFSIPLPLGTILH